MLDDTIRYAVAVARYGSFTAAAARVGISQSAITKRVAELEQRLGHNIFRRTARGVILTDDGVAFVDRATRLLEDLDLLMLRNLDPFMGPLRVGICPAALDGMILKPIAELTRRYPQVRLDVSSSTFEQMGHQLRNGHVDIVLGLERVFREQADFAVEPLASVEAIFFTRKGHPLAARARIPSAELAAYDFVLPSGVPPYMHRVSDIFESAGVPIAARLHAVDYFPLVRMLVARSDAIGLVAASYAQSAEFNANFVIVDAAEPAAPGDLCCAVRARWEVTPIVRAFIQACQKTIGNADIASP